MAPNPGREIYRQNMQHTGFGSDPVDVAPSQKSSVRREVLQKYRGHTDMGAHDARSPKRMASNAPSQITESYLQATECFSRGNPQDAGGGSDVGTIAKWMHNSRSSPPLRRQLSPGPGKCPVGRAKSPETKPEPKCIMPMSMTDELAHKGNNRHESDTHVFHIPWSLEGPSDFYCVWEEPRDIWKATFTAAQHLSALVSHVAQNV